MAAPTAYPRFLIQSSIGISLAEEIEFRSGGIRFSTVFTTLQAPYGFGTNEMVPSRLSRSPWQSAEPSMQSR